MTDVIDQYIYDYHQNIRTNYRRITDFHTLWDEFVGNHYPKDKKWDYLYHMFKLDPKHPYIIDYFMKMKYDDTVLRFFLNHLQENGLITPNVLLYIEDNRVFELALNKLSKTKVHYRSLVGKLSPTKMLILGKWWSEMAIYINQMQIDDLSIDDLFTKFIHALQNKNLELVIETLDEWAIYSDALIRENLLNRQPKSTGYQTIVRYFFNHPFRPFTITDLCYLENDELFEEGLTLPNLKIGDGIQNVKKWGERMVTTPISETHLEKVKARLHEIKWN